MYPKIIRRDEETAVGASARAGQREAIPRAAIVAHLSPSLVEVHMRRRE